MKNNRAMNVQSKLGTIGRDEGHEGEDSEPRWELDKSALKKLGLSKT